MSGFDSFGAGRFLPGGIPQIDWQAAAPQIPDTGAAYQPNYDLFFNPYRMLQMGQPSFGQPWYNSMQVPQMGQPIPAPQMQQSQGPQGLGLWQSRAREAINRSNQGIYFDTSDLTKQGSSISAYGCLRGDERACKQGGFVY